MRPLPLVTNLNLCIGMGQGTLDRLVKHIAYCMQNGTCDYSKQAAVAAVTAGCPLQDARDLVPDVESRFLCYVVSCDTGHRECDMLAAESRLSKLSAEPRAAANSDVEISPVCWSFAPFCANNYVKLGDGLLDLAFQALNWRHALCL